MPTTRLSANSHIETLSQKELDASLGLQTKSWFQEQARGFTTARFGNTASVATGTLRVPATGSSDVFGPDKGFAWRIGRISADGLSTNDVVKVYRNGVTYVGSITATSNLSPGKGLILRGGEFLVITGTGLTATGDITVNGEAISAAELDLYKLL